MDKLQEVRENEHLSTLLMTECDIYFYDKISEVQFSGNNEEYSLACKAFAQNGSGGEYVFLEDNSIGFIGRESQVGRVAERLDDLLTFLLHAGWISDFSCRYLYQNTDLLKAFCRGYVSKIRESYQAKQENWDLVRGNMAQKLSLDFNPKKLEEVAMTFYQAATRKPVFSCKYIGGEEEYTCDSVLSDIVGLWTTELVGMSREEIENYKI